MKCKTSGYSGVCVAVPVMQNTAPEIRSAHAMGSRLAVQFSGKFPDMTACLFSSKGREAV